MKMPLRIPCPKCGEKTLTYTGYYVDKDEHGWNVVQCMSPECDYVKHEVVPR